MHISEREIVTDDDLKNAFLTSEEQVITSKSSHLTVTNQFWNISTDVKDSPCKRARMLPDGGSIMAGSLLHRYLFPHC